MSKDPYGPKEANKQGSKDRPSKAEVEELVDTIIASALGKDPK